MIKIWVDCDDKLFPPLLGTLKFALRIVGKFNLDSTGNRRQSNEDDDEKPNEKNSRAYIKLSGSAEIRCLRAMNSGPYFTIPSIILKMMFYQ